MHRFQHSGSSNFVFHFNKLALSGSLLFFLTSIVLFSFIVFEREKITNITPITNTVWTAFRLSYFSDTVHSFFFFLFIQLLLFSFHHSFFSFFFFFFVVSSVIRSCMYRFVLHCLVLPCLILFYRLFLCCVSALLCSELLIFFCV